MGREIGTDLHTLLYTKQITDENLLYSTGNSVLCGDLNGKKIEKRGGICICIVDSLCCIVETNKKLLSNYMPIKINLKY